MAKKPPAQRAMKKRSQAAAAAPTGQGDSVRPLSRRERLFVEHYAAGGFQNAAKAYEDAGYRSTGTVAAAGASRLLKRVNVAAAVQIERDKLAAQLAARFAITKERVLEELAAMAFYDAADLVLVDPQDPEQVQDIRSPVDIRRLPERIRRCIVGWSWDRHGNFVLKLANKQGSLELIGRHLAMFVDRKEVRVGELERASDAELDAKIGQAAQQIAELEGVPVDQVLAQLRAATTAAAAPSAVPGATLH